MEAAAPCERSDPLERHLGCPENDGRAPVVDSAPARSTGELGVLPRGEELATLAVELRHAFDHDRAGGHVDAERKGLGREHEPHQPLDEARLDRLLERRHHAGVMRRDTGFEPGSPAGEVEHVEICVAEIVNVRIDDLPYPSLFSRVGEPNAGIEAAVHRVVAAGAAEHEHDRREQLAVGEHVEHLEAVGRLETPTGTPALSTIGVATGPPTVPITGRSIDIESGALGVRLAVDEDRHQVRLGRGAVAHQVEVIELDRSPLLDDDRRRPPDGLEPLAEL